MDTASDALSSPQKTLQSTNQTSCSLQRKCSNYWHHKYMLGLRGWVINIPRGDKHVGYNTPNSRWQDLAGHAMVEGARICAKCCRTLPFTSGFTEEQREQFWSEQQAKASMYPSMGSYA